MEPTIATEECFEVAGI